MKSIVAACLLLLTGCIHKKVDRFTVDRVVPEGMAVADMGKVCALGESLAHALAGTGSDTHPPRKALLIAEVTSGMCLEAAAWEAELAGARARKNLPSSEGRTAEIKDARRRADRAHGGAAARFYRSWNQLESDFGPVGEDCPKIAPRDELVYLLGLYAGTNAVLNDKAAGSPNGVPADIIGKVSRGAACLDDAVWWHVPSALQAAAWISIPGSEPAGVDPWVQLAQAAESGSETGVRLARALEVLIAANTGQDDVLVAGILRHAESLESTPQLPEFALLDEYARLVSLHQADLLWTKREGHRAPALEIPPEAPSPSAPLGPDPFADPASGDDLFDGGDPFAEETE